MAAHRAPAERHRRRRRRAAWRGRASRDAVRLGEKRIPGGPLGDDRRQLADRGIRTQQLTQQRRGAESASGASTIVWAPGYLRQRPWYSGREVISTIGRGARDDGQEVGQHRLADRIDPVRILDDEQRGFGARQRRRVHQCGQPAPPRIRVDLGQRHIRVGDAQQIIKQQQILRVGIRKVFPDPGRGVGRRGRPAPVPARSSRVTA